MDSFYTLLSVVGKWMSLCKFEVLTPITQLFDMQDSVTKNMTAWLLSEHLVVVAVVCGA